tara:strand:+ start:183 stop:950 length:768 start_codon:yes stop_codon:yes gene_type:complete
MCNIYKNNLIILSQIKNDQLLYISDNKLDVDNRYLSYYRSGNSENKIVNAINNSFLTIMNNYILNITNIENQKNNIPQDLTMSLEDNIEEIKNTKELLNNSLKGLNIYIKNLELNNYPCNKVLNLNENLNKIFNQIDSYRDEYIDSIKILKNKNNKSESWLYKLYQNTISSNKNEIKENKNNIKMESIIEKEKINNNINDFNDNICLEQNNFKEEENNCNYEETNNFVFGIFYIVGRKISNFIISIGNHINYFFK